MTPLVLVHKLQVYLHLYYFPHFSVLKLFQISQSPIGIIVFYYIPKLFHLFLSSLNHFNCTFFIIQPFEQHYCIYILKLFHIFHHSTISIPHFSSLNHFNFINSYLIIKKKITFLNMLTRPFYHFNFMLFNY